MKTIIHQETKLSKYIFEDQEILNIGKNYIEVVNLNLLISDLNSENSILVESVTPPEDWVGNKYTFEDDTWTLNPNWVDPTVTE